MKGRAGLIYKRLFKIMSALSVLLPVLIIDQLTKFIILKNFQPGESLPVIKNIFHISFVCNKGVAFGVFSEAAGAAFIWISCVSVIIIVFIFAFYKKFFHGIGKYKMFSPIPKDGPSYSLLRKGPTTENRPKVIAKRFSCKRKSTQVFLSLILAGAIGNLIDRIRFGCVIDFLDFRIWPVFNVADSAITIGAVLLILQMLKHKD